MRTHLSLHNFNKQMFWYFTNSFPISMKFPNCSVMGNTQITHCLVKEKPVFRWSSSRNSNLNSLPPLGFFGLTIYTSLSATSSVEERVHVWELSWEDKELHQFLQLPDETSTLSGQQSNFWRSDETSCSQLWTTVFSLFTFILEYTIEMQSLQWNKEDS